MRGDYGQRGGGEYGMLPGGMSDGYSARGGPRMDMPLEARLDFEDPAPSHHHGGGGQHSLFAKVHRLLRGRYVLTITMAAVLAAAGAIGGFMSTKPAYESRGALQYRFMIPIALTGGVTQTMGRPEAYVMGQAQLLLSERTIQKAMMSEAWKKLGVGTGPDQQQQLRDALDANLAPATIDMLYVTCRSIDREYADTAVREVIHAYEDIYKTQSDNIADARIQTLLGRMRDHETRITQFEEELKQILERDGTTDFRGDLDAMSRGITSLREQIRALQLQIAAIEDTKKNEGKGDATPGAPVAGAPAPEGATPAPKTLSAEQQRRQSIEQIGRVDPTMAEYLRQLREAEGALKQLKDQGYTELHPAVKAATALAKRRQAVIDSFADNWTPQGGIAPGGVVIVPPQGQSKEDLIDRLKRFEAQLKEWETERAKLASASAEVDSLNERLRLERQRRDELQRQIQDQETQSQFEVKIQGRVSVLSYGQTPNHPTIDKRKQAAAAGFVLGGGFPVALMLLIGLVDRRLRYSDDTGETGVGASLLGVLPVLPQELTDAEQRAAAAHCVHNIRVMLQINAEARGAKTWMVTSPTSGDGKTSLTLSLGLSFAASGARTIIVDFDMVGTGLSSSVDLRGFHGVVDAIRTGDMHAHVHPSGIDDRLFVLPSAAGDDLHAARLSTAVVRRLIDQLRAEYDVVLFDTGPVLGSLEAAMLAGQVDSVVLVVGRGQQQEFVKRAVQRIHQVGGRLAGLVFNRASGADFKRSFSSASQRSTPLALPSRPGQRPMRVGLKRASPIARTVADDVIVDASIAEENGHAPGA